MSDLLDTPPLAAVARPGAEDPSPLLSGQQARAVGSAITTFVGWLDRFGETSHDHQSFFAGGLGGQAKALYYRRPRLGTLAVAPMIFCEAFVPAARALFWRKLRFPIADAHYAMGFALLSRITGADEHYRRAVHFLEVLEATRCPGYRNFCWGYPFDWVTRTGVIAAGTPLITTTPYVYEAFEAVYRIDGDARWLEVMRSAAEHAATDIKDKELAAGSASAGYTPFDTVGGVINASAYRAFLLTSAGLRFANDEYLKIADRNLAFVLDHQQPDGSWFYAADGVRDFVDHFHTCFVLKALAKIDQMRPRERCRTAIEAGVAFYTRHLFDERRLPKPFSRAPRLTVYRRELYDYAECINLATLLSGQFQELDDRLRATVDDLLGSWRKPDGSFRSRRLLAGWDDVPMHRWAQSQVFRSLCFLLSSGRRLERSEPSA